MNCDGYWSCAYSMINCPINGGCNVSCNLTGCRWSQINGPSNGELVINCDVDKSCFDAIFDGQKVTNFN